MPLSIRKLPDISGRRPLGASGFDVSPLCLGTMQLGWTVSEGDAFALLDAYVEAGGNFIDTANMYGPDQNLMSFARGGSRVGVSEQVIGNWLRSRRLRGQVVVATKVRARMWDGPDGEGLSRKHIEQAAAGSLRRLGVEALDVYVAHWPDEAPLEETMAAFGDLIRAGKVRSIGSSNFPRALMEAADAAADAVRAPRWTSIQPRYSLVNRCGYEDGLLDHCVANDVGCFAFSPLAGGFLAGKYRRDAPVASVRAHFAHQYLNDRGYAVIDALDVIARSHGVAIPSVAIAWVLAQPNVASAVVGANNAAQLADQLSGGSLTLSPDELRSLNEVSWVESDAEFTAW